jgi:hypothetical protein
MFPANIEGKLPLIWSGFLNEATIPISSGFLMRQFATLTIPICGDIVRICWTDYSLARVRRPTLSYPANPAGAVGRYSSRGELPMTPSTTLIPINESQPRAAARAFALIVVTATMLLSLSSGNAQTPRKLAATAAAEEEAAMFKEYRGVQLGMTADEVRKKLGSPKDKGDEQDFFIFGETETAQIVYDQTHKVITISADFLTMGADVPTAKKVFGSDVEAKADGSVYKMVRFTKAGYWLSFNRTSGASPLTTVTLQKIQ